MTQPVSGDTVLQSTVLEELAEAGNYRAWLVSLLHPWLGASNLEIGSGHGDYAEDLAALGAPITVSEADPTRLAELHRRFASTPSVAVRHLGVPITETADYDTVFAVNVLEHIESDVEALRSFARLARPGGQVMVLVPAFPLAMSQFDRDIGHHRRYRKKTLRAAAHAADLHVVHLRHVNGPGLIAWILLVRLARQRPGRGALLQVFDRLVVPVLRRLERHLEPPFGQSLLMVGITSGTCATRP